jgi:hypothetical protein
VEYAHGSCIQLLFAKSQFTLKRPRERNESGDGSLIHTSSLVLSPAHTERERIKGCLSIGKM